MGKFLIWAGQGIWRLLTSALFWRHVSIIVVAVLLLTWSETWIKAGIAHDALHELGFALLVSVLIWAMFEYHLAHEADAEWSRRIERVAQNVFLAVLRKDLPKSLMDEVQKLVLNTSMVRSNFSVTYSLRDATYDTEHGERADCVLMVAVISFTMTNISADAVDYEVGVVMPNPIHPALKAMVRVNSITARKQGGHEPFDLGAAEERFRARLNEDCVVVPYKVGTVRLGPGEAVEIRADYVMAKESEDTEMLGTLYPCDGITCTITDTGQEGKRLLFARSVHPRELETQSSPLSPGTKIFRLSGYLLPQQGVLIWWKNAPSGEQQQLPGVA